MGERRSQALAYGRTLTQVWRKDYNEQHPYTMLGYQMPAEVPNDYDNGDINPDT